jgi:hypothetical protein
MADETAKKKKKKEKDSKGSKGGDRDKWDEVDQRTRVLKVFRRFDTNKSGDIDMQEFRALVLELGRGISPDECRDVFRLIDTDKSGTIDFQEFYAWWTGRRRGLKDSGVWSGLMRFADKLVENPAKVTTVAAAASDGGDVALAERTGSPATSAVAGVASPAEGTSATPRRATAVGLQWTKVAAFEGTWHAPDAAAGQQPAAFCVAGSSGTVVLRGAAVGTEPGVVFVLPVHARPVLTEKFACVRASAKKPKMCMVTVSPDGTVACSESGEVWFSSVSFNVAASV